MKRKKSKRKLMKGGWGGGWGGGEGGKKENFKIGGGGWLKMP